MVAFVDTPATEPTTNEAPSREELLAKVATLMTEGKRDFFANNFTAASEKLGEAVEINTGLFGVTAENFEANLWYGKAMLEMARMEDDLIENAVKDLPVIDEDDSIDEEKFGNPDDLSESVKEEIKAQVDEAMTEETAADTSAVETAVKASAEEATEATEDNKAADGENAEEAEAAEAENAEESGAEDGENVEDDEAEDEEEAEEVTDIQIAWEVLELARTICEKEEQNKEWELKKADVFALLADASLINDDFDKAIEDMNTAIDLQKKHLPANDRVLAQSYVTLARAYKAKDDYENAATYYKLTKETLLSKVAELEASGDTSDEKKEEIEDFKSIVADLDIKIEDADESRKHVEENMNSMRGQLGLSTATTLSAKTTAPAVDITNMIRKPAKRAAENAEDTENAKKSKGDEVLTETTIVPNSTA